jgi:ABC-type antimicrobial peptide transport system permease subunit
MLLGEIIRVALQAIRANKLRAFLTMLGIIIGVGAVITMVALGTGARRAVEDRIQALGPTLLTIFPGQSFRGNVASAERVSLTVDDAEALARNARYVADVVPELSRSLQVKRGNHNVNINVVGTTPNYARVRHYTLSAGRMFTAGEDEARRRYAVVGAALPGQLDVHPLAMIGQEVTVGRQRATRTFSLLQPTSQPSLLARLPSSHSSPSSGTPSPHRGPSTQVAAQPSYSPVLPSVPRSHSSPKLGLGTPSPQ